MRPVPQASRATATVPPRRTSISPAAGLPDRDVQVHHTPYGAKPVRSDLLRPSAGESAGRRCRRSPCCRPTTWRRSLDSCPRADPPRRARGAAPGDGGLEEAIDEAGRDESLPAITEPLERGGRDRGGPADAAAEVLDGACRPGKTAFLSKGCSKCHGEDGRGQTADNIGKDLWGFTTRAADLTSGMLHGGQEPVDVYRRIYSGINGTPMPGFGLARQGEPETIWDLVNHVKFVSSHRREGQTPEPGPIRPYVPAEAPRGAAASATADAESPGG